jgi:ATP-dependent RNA helicase RhlE
LNTQYKHKKRGATRPPKFSNRSSSPRRGSGGGGGGRFRSQYIDPQKFINRKPTVQKEQVYEPNNLFTDFGFPHTVLENLKRMNISHPTKIQDEAIPHVLEGKDVIGLSDTGSGKTAAFVLPLIMKLKSKGDDGTALIIAPTRELAGQIQDDFNRFASGMHLYTTLCVGGMNINPQIRELRRGPSVIIGTPGRIKDLINQRHLDLSKTETFILDEADRMLDMGFLPDIKSIISAISGKPQTLCFSATITPAITTLLDRMLENPVTISVRASQNGDHISQDIIYVKNNEARYQKLVETLNNINYEKVLVFAEMKFTAAKIAGMLTADNFPADSIHGNKNQTQRKRSLDAFKKGKINILVATDVAARGLDIPNVTHVINFEQPQTYEDYIHRIGRTGRAGKEGQAYTFVVSKGK